jgi:hypothetical protein
MLMHCCGSMDVAERLRDQVAGNANSVRRSFCAANMLPREIVRYELGFCEWFPPAILSRMAHGE